MCGIVGALGHGDTRCLPHATAIKHRGPDDWGYWTGDNVTFGHRRLSVLDLSNDAHQPMADGNCALTYNGEIYNFRELRKELQALGCEFKSSGDTEVVFHALRQWGADAIPKFNGMFALAFWDGKKRELLLARDRYGIKPLYYTWHQDTFLFASEIKALLTYGVSAEIDRGVLADYWERGACPGNMTLFRHILILPPGSFLHLRSGEVRRFPYWMWRFNKQPMDYEEAKAETRRLFEQAVKRQLVADVPVNTYLSGGMDTGAITAIASKETPMCSFAVGYGAGDERSAAEDLSRKFGTEHYEAVIKPQDIENSMRSIVWHLEEPRAGQCYPNWYAAKLASKFGKVVLSGVGGDELFNGYPWRDMDSEQTATFLHDLLVVEDKISMAHSLEARVPFLDNDLVDFALTIPKDMKTKDVYGYTFGKWIFRDVMRKTLPRNIIEAPKRGFTAPDEVWFRLQAKPYVERRLMGRDARIFEYIDRAEVHELINAHWNYERNERKRIWSLLYLEEWLGVFCG